MTTVLWILGLVAALIVALFAGQNAQPVRVDFLVWQTSAQLPAVIFISAALGAAVAGVLGAIPLVRTRRQLRHLSAELAQALPGAADHVQPPAPAADPGAAEPGAAARPEPSGSLDAALAEALGEGEKAKPGESV